MNAMRSLSPGDEVSFKKPWRRASQRGIVVQSLASDPRPDRKAPEFVVVKVITAEYSHTIFRRIYADDFMCLHPPSGASQQRSSATTRRSSNAVRPSHPAGAVGAASAAGAAAGTGSAKVSCFLSASAIDFIAVTHAHPQLQAVTSRCVGGHAGMYVWHARWIRSLAGTRKCDTRS